MLENFGYKASIDDIGLNRFNKYYQYFEIKIEI